MSTNDEADIRKVISEWMEASRMGDFKTLAGLVHEDVVFLLPGREPMRGREAFLSNFKQGLGKYELEARADIQQIQIAGDWAWCWNYLRVQIKPANGSETITREGNVISIFRKQDNGRWVIYRDANLLAVKNNGTTE